MTLEAYPDLTPALSLTPPSYQLLENTLAMHFKFGVNVPRGSPDMILEIIQQKGVARIT